MLGVTGNEAKEWKLMTISTTNYVNMAARIENEFVGSNRGKSLNSL